MMAYAPVHRRGLDRRGSERRDRAELCVHSHRVMDSAGRDRGIQHDAVVSIQRRMLLVGGLGASSAADRGQGGQRVAGAHHVSLAPTSATRSHLPGCPDRSTRRCSRCHHLRPTPLRHDAA